MRGIAPEPIQKHLVEVDGTSFPPKQVFGAVTGRPRTSFTTMEAQRVLRRLDFVCRAVGRRDEKPGWASENLNDDADAVSRLMGVETTVATLEAAVAGLQLRVKALEAA